MSGSQMMLSTVNTNKVSCQVMPHAVMKTSVKYDVSAGIPCGAVMVLVQMILCAWCLNFLP
jgi:hypothetical protein